MSKIRHLGIYGVYVCALALAACTQDELVDNNTLPEGMYPLEIASVTLAVESSEQPWTRVSESADGQSSVWETGDEFYVKFEDSDDVGTYRITDAEAGTVEAVTPAYWQSTATEQTIIAWYASPETDGAIDLSDQTGGLAYVLRAKTTADFNSTVASLGFEHRLAKIRVKLEGKIEGITSVSVESCTSCTHSQGDISTTDATTGDIAMHKVDDATWEANVVPGQEISTIKVNTTATNLNTSITPEAGKMHTIDLTVSKHYDVSSDGTYTVYTAEGLLAWANAANSNAGTNCILTTDIDMNDLSSYSWPRIISYRCTFDGAGHTISNLKIESSPVFTGFIGHINGGVVKNLTLVGASVTGTNNYVGGIAGQVTNGSISGCSFSGTVTGTGNFVGGIAGHVTNGSISGCSFSGTVTGTGDFVGGIVGDISDNGTVSACYSTANVTANSFSGGIAGLNYGTVTDCYSNVTTPSEIGTNGYSFDGDWSKAMDVMNPYLTNSGYQWALNTDSDAATTVPLVLVSE